MEKNSSRVSRGDIELHVIKFGLDIYPPIDLEKELTHLNIFFEKMRDKHGEVYGQLNASSSEFTIFGDFGKRNKPQKMNTFTVTPRGGVFLYPIKLPAEENDTAMASKYLDVFESGRETLLQALGGTKVVLRVGQIREIIFRTGDDVCADMIEKSDNFGNANLMGARNVVRYEDSLCNVTISMGTVFITTGIPHPVGVLQEKRQNGLKVELDVNNKEIKPLDGETIEQIIQRAEGFWPDTLLEFISRR